MRFYFELLLLYSFFCEEFFYFIASRTTPCINCQGIASKDLYGS